MNKNNPPQSQNIIGVPLLFLLYLPPPQLCWHLSRRQSFSPAFTASLRSSKNSSLASRQAGTAWDLHAFIYFCSSLLSFLLSTDLLSALLKSKKIFSVGNVFSFPYHQPGKTERTERYVPMGNNKIRMQVLAAFFLGRFGALCIRYARLVYRPITTCSLLWHFACFLFLPGDLLKIVLFAFLVICYRNRLLRIR